MKMVTLADLQRFFGEFDYWTRLLGNFDTTDFLFLGKANLQALSKSLERDLEDAPGNIQRIQETLAVLDGDSDVSFGLTNLIDRICKTKDYTLPSAACIESLKEDLTKRQEKLEMLPACLQRLGELIEQADEKPIFPSRRASRWLSVGDEVAYLWEDQKQRVFLFGKCVGRVCKDSSGPAIIQLDQKGQRKTVHAGDLCPLLLHKEELEYLWQHPDYAQLWYDSSYQHKGDDYGLASALGVVPQKPTTIKVRLSALLRARHTI